MNKLTDQQRNFAILGVGVFLALIFGYLTYSDYGTIDEIVKKRQGVEKEIMEATRKKNEIPKMKEELYLRNQAFQNFRKLIPRDDEDEVKNEFLKFYEQIDSFRINQKMKPFVYFRSLEDHIRLTEGLEPKKEEPKKKSRSRRNKKAAPAGPFKPIKYIANLDVTYNQLGRLLQSIEKYERFYAVTSISMPSFEVQEVDGNTLYDEPYEGNVTLNFTTFSYQNKNQEKLDTELAKHLKNFKPKKSVLERLEKLQSVLNQQDDFEWTDVQSPFDKRPIVGIDIPIPKGGDKPSTSTETETNIFDEVFGKTDISGTQEPPTEEKVKKLFEDIEASRQSLALTAAAENWGELEVQIRNSPYEKLLSTIIIKSDVDPEGVYQRKLKERKDELRDWKRSVVRANKVEKARQFIPSARAELEKMENLYNEGRDQGSKNLLADARKIYDNIVLLMKNYEDVEKEVEELREVKVDAEKLLSKVDTHIKLINMASKLKLQGIIYMEDTPRLSVALINNKAVRKDDILLKEFVIDKIQDEEVVLKYQEETVAIKLKRARAKNFIQED